MLMMYPPLRLEGLPFELERDLLPIIPRNLQIVSSGVKSSSRWLPVWEYATRRPTPFAVRSSTKLGQRSNLVKSKPTFSLSTKAFPPRLSTAWQADIHPQTLRSPSKPDRTHIFMISGAIRGTHYN
ncbi:hypothetical protein Tco_0024017 [Tanacetum coccineum]